MELGHVKLAMGHATGGACRSRFGLAGLRVAAGFLRRHRRRNGKGREEPAAVTGRGIGEGCREGSPERKGEGEVSVGRIRKEKEEDNAWHPCVSGCGGRELKQLLGFGEWEIERVLE